MSQILLVLDIHIGAYNHCGLL